MDAERDRREDAVGERLPRPVGAVRAGPDLGRERAGRADVQPRRLRASGLVRPARLRRPRPGPAAAPGAPAARGGAEPDGREAGRARAAHPEARRRAPATRRRAPEHAGKPASRAAALEARAPRRGSGGRGQGPAPRAVRGRGDLGGRLTADRGLSARASVSIRGRTSRRPRFRRPRPRCASGGRPSSGPR